MSGACSNITRFFWTICMNRPGVSSCLSVRRIYILGTTRSSGWSRNSYPRWRPSLFWNSETIRSKAFLTRSLYWARSHAWTSPTMTSAGQSATFIHFYLQAGVANVLWFKMWACAWASSSPTLSSPAVFDSLPASLGLLSHLKVVLLEGNPLRGIRRDLLTVGDTLYQPCAVYLLAPSTVFADLQLAEVYLLMPMFMFHLDIFANSFRKEPQSFWNI